MKSLTLLTIDGRDLKDLIIIKYTPKRELLDGPGTERTRADGWELIRDPQGLLVNFSITILETFADNSDFLYFLDKHESLGSKEFVSVGHIDEKGKLWVQDMYYVIDAYDVTFSNGRARTSNITARFIARKGRK